MGDETKTHGIDRISNEIIVIIVIINYKPQEITWIASRV
jgi:hypothetical protein